jgi:hypothetical protein
MKTFSMIFICLCTLLGSNYAQDYTAFSETFGNPGTPISQSTYDVPLVPASPATINHVLNFIPVPGGTSCWPVPEANSSWYYNGTNNYYGIITSADLFGGNIIGSGGSGGMLAFTWTNKGATTGFDTFWRIMVPGDRFVKGENYELSGYVAGDAGADWNPANEGTRVLNFGLRSVMYFAVTSLSGTDFGTINSVVDISPNSTSDTTSVTNGAGWTPFSLRSDRYLSEPSGVVGDVVIDLRCNHSKSTVILIDELKIDGPRPVISALQNEENCNSLVFVASNSNPDVSDAVSVACNHAGKTPISASITGEGASYFSLCDQSGNPYEGNYAVTGDNVYVKFSPDGSVAATQTATLTLIASSDQTYGAEPVTISLTGNLDLGTDLQLISGHNKMSLDNSVVSDLLSARVNMTNEVGWTIYNLIGKQIYTVNGDQNLYVNMADFSAGSYILVARDKVSGESVSAKFIKK